MTMVYTLTAALKAEDAAIFTYGVLTAFTRNDVRKHLAEDIAAHRVLRRVLTEYLTKAGAIVPNPAAGYLLPMDVTEVRSAGRAATEAELGTQVAYRSVVEQADTDLIRRFGAVSLTESAVRAVYWRGVAGIYPAVIAMPGDPRINPRIK